MQKYVHVERPVQEIKPLLEGKFGMKLLGVFLTKTDSGVYNWHTYKMGQNYATLEEPFKQTLTHQEKLDPTVYLDGKDEFVKTLLEELK